MAKAFPEEVAELILHIPLAMEPHSDFLAWTGEPSGEYTVRSAYKLLQSGDPRAYAVQNVWNYLPTRVNMQLRRLANNTTCSRCGVEVETMDHLSV